MPIVACGCDGSPGVAPLGGLSEGRWVFCVVGSGVLVVGSGVLSEGGADAPPGGGDGVCPAPGGVDAQP
jgi:hypothetical protein